MAHTPYSTAPDQAFWSRSVSRNFQPDTLVEADAVLLRKGDTVMSAGSCFAANMVPYLRESGFDYVRAETRHPLIQVQPEALGYENFSAAYGNIYTARQLLQLLQRALGQFQPQEAFWEEEGTFIDPFRPGLRYRARSQVEFELLTRQHLDAVRRAFEAAKVFVFTLGLTECWVSRADGAVFPACPGTVAGTFDAGRHAFHNLTTSEIVADLSAFIALVRTINPELRIILTVSPVPLVATATGRHVLDATIYSKSVLRAAAGEVAMAHDNVSYFPAYEIVTGPQAPQDFLAPNRRDVSKAAVDTVMSVLLSHSEAETRPSAAPQAEATARQVQDLSRDMIQAECEEEMLDARRERPAPKASPKPTLRQRAARVVRPAIAYMRSLRDTSSAR